MWDAAIVVTGAVALGVPCLAALWAWSIQRPPLAPDRDTRELEALRRVFDEAVAHLVETDIALSRWGLAGARLPLLLDDENLRQRAYAASGELLHALRAACQQVA